MTAATLRSDVRAATEEGTPISAIDAFRADCLHGLVQAQKTIPCKWLYDERGSALFEQICTTPEYYPSRTEMALLAEAAPWLAQRLALNTELVEFGSGASRKTRILLDAAASIARYVPIDISGRELERACAKISADYPRISVCPLLGDFTEPSVLGRSTAGVARLGFFPGSTLGNFTRAEAVGFLRNARSLLGEGNRLLLGVDLAKDERTLLAAYDDMAGVTAAFNLNLIHRMNRELGCAIDPSAFRHRALWNGSLSRIEMHLVSLRRQTIEIGEASFLVAEGETIHTENSHKHSRSELGAMFGEARWTVERRWSSEAPNYDLTLLRC